MTQTFATVPARTRWWAGAAMEWTKLWTVPTTWVAVAATVVLMAGVAVLTGLSVAASAANGYDVVTSPATLAAQALVAGQVPVAVLAGLAVTGEYANGAIGTTLRVMPRRGLLLLARSAVVAGIAALTGILAMIVATAVATIVLGAAAETSTAEVLRAVAGGAGYLAALAVLVVGLATALRGTAATLLSTLLLILVLPTALGLVDVDWVVDRRELLPSIAAAALMTDAAQPYGPGLAAVVLVGWAVVAQLAGYAVLTLRDA